ncbi:NR1H1 [Lepeophtheirus salmonis]|uniref:NR1H1 n=1 Tax=Lepeophtheirus salmonis TaxID=72036 RepID=A0A7R8D0G3_LEPSM|nr:NR1H1 [Lepeophtheirus salmonis]CAF2958723.1 NR1H1 [Lepeophtheirus salmonis]
MDPHGSNSRFLMTNTTKKIDNSSPTVIGLPPPPSSSPIFASASSSPLIHQQHQQSLFIETMSNNGSYSTPSPILSEIKTEPHPYSPPPPPTTTTLHQQHSQQNTHYYLNNSGESPSSPLENGLRHPNAPLTPTGAVQQYSQMVENERKKKGSSSRPAEELCLVCGDRASGLSL